MSKTVQDVDKLLTQLGADKNKIILDALIAGGKALVRQTKSNLESSPFRAKAVSNKNPKNMVKGVRMKADKTYNTVKVHIMGDYRLKWFETGTAFRKTKKGQNRGAIKAYGFFAKARQNESAIMNAIYASLDKALNNEIKSR